MRTIIAAACIVVLVGCASSAPQPTHGVVDADEAMIENCEFLGNVDATSGWGNAAAARGIQKAKEKARQKASSMGATHILWGDFDTVNATTVTGKAYRCE